MSLPTTPRINSTLLSSHHGKTVRIIGKAGSHEGGIFTFDANGPLKVKPDENEFVEGRFYELVGKVEDSGELTCLQSTDFGTNIDLEQVGKLVAYCQKFPTVFGDS
ncbi:Replication factor A protein 3 [Yarrowia sp. B02]|nr:Replication factor A protein 3 [Yarrowia sp. B02]